MKFIVGDVETFGSLDSKFKFGVIYDGKKSHIFRDRNSMINWLKNYSGIIYFHNLQFDLSKIFEKDIFKLDLFLTNSGQILRAKFNNCEFRDSQAILILSLKKLGGKEDIPLSLLQQPDISQREIDYCINDCQILYNHIKNLENIIQEVRKDLNGEKVKKWGKLPLTIGSIGMKMQNEYYKFNITLQDKKTKRKYLNPRVMMYNDYCRAAYYGGRTENRVIGVVKRELYYYDVNSLYPYVMRTFKIPNPTALRMYHKLSWSEVKRHDGVAHVKVQILKSCLPVRIKGRVYFSVTGEVDGYWNINELRYFNDLGYIKIKKVYDCVITDDYISFEDYINLLYEKRLYFKSNNDNREKMIKILMNSSYGKYGERVGGVELIPVFDDSVVDELVQQGYYPIMEFDDYELWERKVELSDTNHTAVIIASYISSYARIVLHEYIRAVEEAGGSVYYNDTDSIITDVQLPDAFVGSELGKLKLEDKINKALFLAPKFYAYLSTNNKEILKHKGERNVSRFRSMSEQERYYKYKTAIRKNIIPYTLEIFTKKFSIDNQKYNYSYVRFDKLYDIDYWFDVFKDENLEQFFRGKEYDIKEIV